MVSLLVVCSFLTLFYHSHKLEKLRRNISSKYVPYSELEKVEEYLKANQIIEADQKTQDILLTLAGKNKKKWLLRKDIYKLSCPYLITIDDIWTRLSSNRQGFTRQGEIWAQITNQTNQQNKNIEIEFKNKVGWITDSNTKDPFSNLPGYYPNLIHSVGTLNIQLIANRLKDCQKPNLER